MPVCVIFQPYRLIKRPISSSSQFPIIQLSLRADDTNSDIRLLAEELEKELRRTEGVASVNVSGKLVEEIQITLDEQALIEKGLTQSDVVQIVQANNILSGMKFDMTKQMLGFDPKIEKENFTCIWNIDSGWGQIHTTKTEAALSVLDGSVTLNVLALPFLTSVTKVLADGKPVSFAFDKQTGNIVFEKAVTAEKEIKVCSM